MQTALSLQRFACRKSKVFLLWVDELTSSSRGQLTSLTCATRRHSSDKYDGAIPWRHLNTVRYTLRLILSGTSRWCRSECRILPSESRIALVNFGTYFLVFLHLELVKAYHCKPLVHRITISYSNRHDL